MVSGAPSALAGTDMDMPGFVGYGMGPDNSPDPSVCLPLPSPAVLTNISPQKAENSYWGAALLRMVQNGTVPQWRVDDMVTRAMAAYYYLEQDKDFPAVKYVHTISPPLTKPTHLAASTTSP